MVLENLFPHVVLVELSIKSLEGGELYHVKSSPKLATNSSGTLPRAVITIELPSSGVCVMYYSSESCVWHVDGQKGR